MASRQSSDSPSTSNSTQGQSENDRATTTLPDGGYTTNTSSSKLQTDCKEQHMNSLQCIQDNYETKDVSCLEYFKVYKECRKNEHAAILERNRQSSSKSFWG